MYVSARVRFLPEEPFFTITYRRASPKISRSLAHNSSENREVEDRHSGWSASRRHRAAVESNLFHSRLPVIRRRVYSMTGYRNAALWAGITLSIGNLCGVVIGARYGWPKNTLHWKGIQFRRASSISAPQFRSISLSRTAFWRWKETGLLTATVAFWERLCSRMIRWLPMRPAPG